MPHEDSVRNAPASNPLASTLPVAAVLAIAASVGAWSARADTSIGDAFLSGSFNIETRYRFEYVDQAGFSEEANAHTLRVRAGYQTGRFADFQALAEIEGVIHLNDDFNDTVNGRVSHPIVADPEDLQVNRLQVEYLGIPETIATVGRQRINFDNQRFVGGVAFRQNEQTFDAVRISNTSIEKLTLSYAFVAQVNRVFGEESPQGAFEGSTHLANVGYDIPGWGKLAAYAYLIDLNEMPTLSTQSFGLRFAGKHDIADGLTALYAVEYASQHEYASNTGKFDLNYSLVEAGFTTLGFKVLGGVETLGGDGARGFSTPLATLHKFQGYADVFLNTPSNGIVDKYASAAYETSTQGVEPLTGLMAAVIYHDYSSEKGDASLGSEVDVELVARFGEHVSAGIKYASYDGDSGFADRDKVWLSLDLTY